MKTIALYVLLISLPLLSGCWDMREINELGLVMAVGIDKSSNNPDHYLVTVQVANPQAGGSSADSSINRPETIWISSAEGKTIFEAIRELARISSQRIMWAHNNVIVIGESLARDDITPVIDFFSHNHELRMKTWMAVAKGSATDFLKAKAGMGSIPGQSLADMFRYQQFTGLDFHSNLLKVYGDFTSDTTNLLIGSLSLEQATTQAGLSKVQENTVEQIQMDGMAVFDQRRMLGYLSEDETRGLAWFLSENPNMVISVPHPSDSSESVAVEIVAVKAKIDSQLDQQTPSFSIQITGTGHIAEEDTTSDLSINDFKHQMEFLAEQQIIEEIELGLDKVLNVYKSDVLGFGKVVHSQHKKEWNQGLKDRWVQIFPDVEISVAADIEIKSSTLNQIPLRNYRRSSVIDDEG